MMMTVIHMIGATAGPAAPGLPHPGCLPRREAAGRSGLCSVGVTLTGSVQGAFPVEAPLMLDPSFREMNRRQALARETKPERGRVRRTLTGGREIDSTNNLDR
jgi:hypothetical protein